jgi:putative ABC transport system permease protein
MFKHILTLTWNRRWANALIVIEVMIAFLALFVLISISYHTWSNYQRPLGFKYDNIWEISIRIEGAWQDNDIRVLPDVVNMLNALPNVRIAHAQSHPAFRNANWSTDLPSKNGTVIVYQNRLSEGAQDTLGIRLLDGRWPLVGESKPGERVVAINRYMRSQFFDEGESPIDQIIVNDNPNPQFRTQYRVVGVFDDYRQKGELSEQVPYMIMNLDLNNSGGTARTLFVKVAPDTPVSDEELMLNTVKSIAPHWDIGVAPWHELRERQLSNVLTPLRISAVLAGFFLLMVAMGLIGVLWQDVLRRTQEIGLRKALGAPGGSVRLQIIGEVLAVTVLGIVVGSVLAVQLPMLELVDSINWKTTPVALSVSSLIILALASFAAYYPSYIAGRYTPSEALRYE